MRACASSRASSSPSSSSRSSRITAGSVSPWITSVPKMTANVRKRIRFRSGNASPASVVSGIASAAASETPPRMPDQEISASQETGGIGSRSRIRRKSRRGSHAEG
jgi:hypothetical protein